MFNNFAKELLHEAEHGETPQYVRVNRAMPDLAHQLREQHDNVINTMSAHHQSVLAKNNQEHAAASISNKQEHTLTRDTIIHNLQPIVSVLMSLSNQSLTFHTKTSSDTRVQLADSSYIANIVTETSLFNSNLVTATDSFSQSLINEESTALNTIAASEFRSNSIEQYRLASHVNTVVELWKEYKTGISHRAGASAGPSIEQLNEQFGAKWRTRDDCGKAYSRRRHI